MVGHTLTGAKKHYCPDWDFLPIDDTCLEMESCTCYEGETPMVTMTKEQAELLAATAATGLLRYGLPVPKDIQDATKAWHLDMPPPEEITQELEDAFAARHIEALRIAFGLTL